MSAQRLAAQLLDEEDLRYLEALRAAGVLAELENEELLRVASEVSESDAERRFVDFLEIYYAAAGDAEVGKRRRLADRFFLQKVGEPATAALLVKRLAALAPELVDVTLERIGRANGPLVLRCGEHMSAVLDDYEEETDAEDFDLREAEARKRGVMMVTVRGLVRSVNVLLARHEVTQRLIPLSGDDDREVYVAVRDVAAGLSLAKAGYLEVEDTRELFELCAW